MTPDVEARLAAHKSCVDLHRCALGALAELGAFFEAEGRPAIEAIIADIFLHIGELGNRLELGPPMTREVREMLVKTADMVDFPDFER